jgi:Iron/manganese superoxide dismutases, C-terminal domain
LNSKNPLHARVHGAYCSSRRHRPSSSIEGIVVRQRTNEPLSGVDLELSREDTSAAPLAPGVAENFAFLLNYNSAPNVLIAAYLRHAPVDSRFKWGAACIGGCPQSQCYLLCHLRVGFKTVPGRAEHAFILDYAPADRGKYIEAFFSNIHWQAVEERLRSEVTPSAAA